MVSIKDFDMPKCCADCKMLDDRYDYPTCVITSHSRGYNFNILNKRMPDCPLVESIIDKMIEIK